MIKLGMLTSSLSEDFAQAFELSAQAGSSGVELSYSSKESLEMLGDDSHIQQIKELAARHDQQVTSLCMSFIVHRPALINSSEDAYEAIQLVARACEVARQLEARVVVLPFFGHSAIQLEEQLDKAVMVLEELAEPAEKAGVTLAVESTLNITRHQFLLDHFAHTSGIRICFNTGIALARKMDLATGLRMLGKNAIATMHLKDVRITEAMPPDYNVQLGEGQVDFRAVAQAIKALQYDGWIILKTPAGEDPLGNAKKNLQFVHNLLGLEVMAKP
jgi:sugar phosphate isomerase/epimerase